MLFLKLYLQHNKGKPLLEIDLAGANARFAVVFDFCHSPVILERKLAKCRKAHSRFQSLRVVLALRYVCLQIDQFN